MSNNIKLMWKNFKDGTILWLKILVFLIIVLSVSYFLSNYISLFAIPPFIFSILSLPGAIFKSSLLSYLVGFAAFPIYLWIFINFVILSRKKICPMWFSVFFWVVTNLYIIAIIVGLIIVFVVHPITEEEIREFYSLANATSLFWLMTGKDWMKTKGEKTHLTWQDFLPGTLSWLKFLIPFILLAYVSYIFFLWPLIPSNIFSILILHILLLAYFWIFTNYLALSKRNKGAKWFTLFFIVATITYILSIFLGWIIAFVVHP